MIRPLRTFYMTPFRAGQEPVELTIDLKYIDFVANLPYITSIVQDMRHRNLFFIWFDPRYEPFEAWRELNRELQVETMPVTLSEIWGDDDADDEN